MALCCGAAPARHSPALPVRHFRHFNSVPLVCSWSANSSLQRGFVLGTQLRLDTHSRLHQTSLSVQGRNALRTITAAFDPELHSVLELASDAELSELSSILYGQSPLSPLLKSVAPGDGSNRGTIAEAMHEQEYGGRDALMERLESRFMFLAADAKATLSGRRPTYRDVLLRVRSKLSVPCSVKLSTEDMEAEIFLHLLQDYSSQPKKRPQSKRRAPYLEAIERAKGSRFRHNISSAIRLGSEELLTTILKDLEEEMQHTICSSSRLGSSADEDPDPCFRGSSAVTLSTLQRFITKKLSGKVLVETARYQLAKDALVKGGQVVAAKLESQVAMLAAKQTLAGAAARYMTLRSTMMVLGPLLWGTFLADIVIRSIGTDYARVVRAIYAFAQIRLSRTYGWTRAEIV